MKWWGKKCTSLGEGCAHSPPRSLRAQKEMEAPSHQQQSKISAVLLHAAWYLLRCKTFAMAIPCRLSNSFSWHWPNSPVAQPATVVSRRSLSSSLIGSLKVRCPTVPNRASLIDHDRPRRMYPVGGCLVHGDPWAIKVGLVCKGAARHPRSSVCCRSVQGPACGCAVPFSHAGDIWAPGCPIGRALVVAGIFACTP